MFTARRAERIQRAAELGLSARLAFVAKPDRRIQSIQVALEQIVGEADFPSGRYYVLLSDAGGTWRLTGELADGAEGLQLGAGDRGE